MKRKNRGTRRNKVRKTVVTIREENDIDVSIQFFPVGELLNPGLCAHVGMKAFAAAVDEINRLNQDGDPA